MVILNANQENEIISINEEALIEKAVRKVIDFLHMLKLDGIWRIVNIIDY